MLLKRRVWLNVSFAIGLGLLAASLASAQIIEDGSSFTPSSGEYGVPPPPPPADEYFTLDETPIRVQPQFSPPEELLKEVGTAAGQMFANLKVSLLKWVKHLGAPAEPDVPYNRIRHFGGWVNLDQDGTCYNTRAKVLSRDSARPVTYSGPRGCIVDTGLWKDPYTGHLFESGSQMQIDHMVPLKNAYVSGAWKWTPQKRCLYANFMANPGHLLSVSGTANMQKGERTPTDYMPPDPNYTCSYLKEWLKVKLVWGLVMLSDEVRSISEILQQSNCRTDQLAMTPSQLIEFRNSIRTEGACSNFTGQVRIPQLPTSPPAQPMPPEENPAPQPSPSPQPCAS